jgi:Fe2+ or Zn2+ uptake regulation protein
MLGVSAPGAAVRRETLVTHALEIAVRIMRAHGRRITPQRRAVVHALAALGCAGSAEEVLARARRDYRRLGLVTVYRTLDALVAEGLAQALYLGDGRTRYELTDTGHHHHMTCLSCGMVERLEGCLLRRGVRLRTGGFAVTGHRLELFGYCANCRKARR